MVLMFYDRSEHQVNSQAGVVCSDTGYERGYMMTRSPIHGKLNIRIHGLLHVSSAFISYH